MNGALILLACTFIGLLIPTYAFTANAVEENRRMDVYPSALAIFRQSREEFFHAAGMALIYWLLEIWLASHLVREIAKAVA